MKNQSMPQVAHLLPLFFCSLLLTLCSSVHCSWADEQSPPSETVVIGGQEYIVPESWQGGRFDSPPLTAPPLVRVPPQFVKDGGEIYLLSEARNAFTTMAETAEKDNVELLIDSGYRSARYQKKIIKRLMEQGKTFEEVVRYVAPPGYSEHMLGLAVDFSPSNWRFADAPAYQWLKEHAATFGFAETYPESRPLNKPWEPSHWRYHSRKQ